MKKILTISILFVMMLAVCAPFASATTAAELPDQLFAIASKYGATAADKIKIERYLADNTVTEAQANAIMEKARAAEKIMDEAGVTDVKKLSADKKNELKTIANEAASVAGLTLTFEKENVKVYKNGKLIEQVNANSVASTGSSAGAGTTNGGAKLVYTGSNSYIVLAIGSTVVLALATIAIARKKSC